MPSLQILATTSPQIYVLGEDAGLANVLKLSGNFLIAAAIEALAEALALAEANGLDRRQAAGMLTSTIFDCIIYKGYGQRVSERDHRPGGFALELGLKDVKLVLDAAEKAKVAWDSLWQDAIVWYCIALILLICLRPRFRCRSVQYCGIGSSRRVQKDGLSWTGARSA
eukprot:scaffold1878_cov258-Pinguiococcus_pyrenoidosus.AAC.21